VYDGGIAYTAYITLRAQDGYKFAGFIEPIIDSSGTILGNSSISDESAKNSISFIVAYPPTGGSGGLSISGNITLADITSDVTKATIQLRRQSDNQMLGLPVHPNASGEYIIPGLVIGLYKVEVRLISFKSAFQESISVTNIVIGINFTLEKTDILLSINGTDNLGAQNTGDLGAVFPSAVNWQSLNTNIATVTADGRISAVSPGNATITCNSGALTFSVKVAHFIFLSDVAIANYLTSGNLGVSSAGNIANPITVLLYALDNAAFTSGSDGLGRLIQAVPNGKYVSYDLTGSTITTLSGSAGRSASNPQTRIVSFTMPTTITSIADNTFKEFKGLRNIVLTAGVTSLADSTFAGCSALQTINLGNLTSIGTAAFDGCASLNPVNISGISSIADSTFRGCSSLTNITIPSSPNFTIGKNAFQNCTALGGITIPANCILVDDYAFANCRSFSTITLNSGLKTIGNYAFCGDASPSPITTLVIPNTVETIGAYAFANYHTLASLTIGNSVKTIGAGAFSSTTSYSAAPIITSLVIPASVETVGANAFANCHALTSLTLNSGLKTIGNYAFSSYLSSSGAGNSAYTPVFTTVTIPATVISIGSYAFSYCTSLQTLTITTGSEAAIINNGAFYNCSNLTTASIPARVTTLGTTSSSSPSDGVFANCRRLNLTLLTGLQTIGNYTFYGCVLLVGTIQIPNSVTTIGSYAFYDCRITEVSGATGLISVGSYAFASCTTLTNIAFPTAVTSLSASLFAGCTALSSFTIQNTVTSIGAGTFSGCTALNSITIPTAVTSIGANAFSNCTTLNTVNITASSLNTIGASAFSGCTALNSITIPATVTSLSASLFSGCTTLSSFTIQNTVTEIGASTFAGCKSLGAVSMQGVQRIGALAFSGCTNINFNNIILPSTLVKLGEQVFSGCTNLNALYVLADLPPELVGTDSSYSVPNPSPPPTYLSYSYTNFYTFSGTGSSFKIYLPNATALTTYQAANGWGVSVFQGPDTHGNNYYSKLDTGTPPP
jgi:hypothetical protein